MRADRAWYLDGDSLDPAREPAFSFPMSYSRQFLLSDSSVPSIAFNVMRSTHVTALQFIFFRFH